MAVPTFRISLNCIQIVALFLGLNLIAFPNALRASEAPAPTDESLLLTKTVAEALVQYSFEKTIENARPESALHKYYLDVLFADWQRALSADKIRSTQEYLDQVSKRSTFLGRHFDVWQRIVPAKLTPTNSKEILSLGPYSNFILGQLIQTEARLPVRERILKLIEMVNAQMIVNSQNLELGLLLVSCFTADGDSEIQNFANKILAEHEKTISSASIYSSLSLIRDLVLPIKAAGSLRPLTQLRNQYLSVAKRNMIQLKDWVAALGPRLRDRISQARGQMTPLRIGTAGSVAAHVGALAYSPGENRSAPRTPPESQPKTQISKDSPNSLRSLYLLQNVVLGGNLPDRLPITDFTTQPHEKTSQADWVQKGLSLLKGEKQDWLEFFLAGESFGTERSVAASALAEDIISRRLAQLNLAVGAYGKDDLETFRKFSFDNFIKNYRRNFDSLSNLFTSFGGNCVARALYFVSALKRRPDLIPTGFELGLVITKQHIEPVLVSKDQVWLLVFGDKFSYDGAYPIWKPEILVRDSLRSFASSNAKNSKEWSELDRAEQYLLRKPARGQGDWKPQLSLSLLTAPYYALASLTDRIYSGVGRGTEAFTAGASDDPLINLMDNVYIPAYSDSTYEKFSDRPRGDLSSLRTRWERLFSPNRLRSQLGIDVFDKQKALFTIRNIKINSVPLRICLAQFGPEENCFIKDESHSVLISNYFIPDYFGYDSNHITYLVKVSKLDQPSNPRHDLRIFIRRTHNQTYRQFLSTPAQFWPLVLSDPMILNLKQAYIMKWGNDLKSISGPSQLRTFFDESPPIEEIANLYLNDSQSTVRFRDNSNFFILRKFQRSLDQLQRARQESGYENFYAQSPQTKAASESLIELREWVTRAIVLDDLAYQDPRGFVNYFRALKDEDRLRIVRLFRQIYEHEPSVGTAPLRTFLDSLSLADVDFEEALDSDCWHLPPGFSLPTSSSSDTRSRLGRTAVKRPGQRNSEFTASIVTRNRPNACDDAHVSAPLSTNNSPSQLGGASNDFSERRTRPGVRAGNRLRLNHLVLAELGMLAGSGFHLWTEETANLVEANAEKWKSFNIGSRSVRPSDIRLPLPSNLGLTDRSEEEEFFQLLPAIDNFATIRHPGPTRETFGFLRRIFPRITPGS